MKDKKRHPLSLQSRQVLYSMRSNGVGVRDIARYLRINPSIVSRELKRNRSSIKLGLSGVEKGTLAHELAKRRLKERKRGKRGAILTQKVRDHIIDSLIAKKSPEAISATMEAAIGTKVSCATIYRWIHRDALQLKQYLYEKGKKRRQRVMNRRGRFQSQKAAATKRSHEDRSDEAILRKEPGHFEGDTIHGCKNSNAAIVSIRERKFRVHFFEKVPNLEAGTVTRCIVRLLHRIPSELRKTITFDRGSEFADWEEIEKIFPELKVYFCDAYCPYQKGGNERGNRDFRKYFPKGTNFDAVNCEDVRQAQNKVNQNPMKLHQWRSPAEVAPLLAAA